MVALRSFIDAFDTEGLQQVKPLIPQLLDVFFQLLPLSLLSLATGVLDVFCPAVMSPNQSCS